LKPKPFFEEPNKFSLVPVRGVMGYNHILTQNLKLYIASYHCMSFNTGMRTLVCVDGYIKTYFLISFADEERNSTFIASNEQPDRSRNKLGFPIIKSSACRSKVKFNKICKTVLYRDFQDKGLSCPHTRLQPKTLLLILKTMN